MYLAEPATTSVRPKVPLWESWGRIGSESLTHAGVMSSRGASSAKARRYPDVHHLQPSRASGSGEGEEADFGIAQGYRNVCRGAVDVHLSRIRVQPGGHVQRHESELRPGGLCIDQPGEDICRRPLYGPPSSRAQYGVYHQPTFGQPLCKQSVVRILPGMANGDSPLKQQTAFGVVLHPRQGHVHRHVLTPVAEVARCHHSIGAVVAGADKRQYRDATAAAQKLPSLPRYGQPCLLHQVVGGDALRGAPRLQEAHLVNGYYLH